MNPMNTQCLRSECPINYLVEIVGDKWSLLVIRDMLLDGKRSYGQFLDSEEHIATNILADRLSSLESKGVISRRKDPSNGKRFIYSLSEKGLDLLPLFVEIIFWSEKYAPFPVPEDRKALVALAREDRESFIEEVKRQLRDQDSDKARI